MFCGVELDAEKKTMRISEKTFFKLKEQVENNLLTKIDGTKTMSFDEFQTMMGIIARLARTSTSGYCNAHNLLARLAEAQNSQFKMVEFTKEDLVELNYWTSERREMPMKMFSVTAASFKLSDEVVVDEKDAKRRKLNEMNALVPFALLPAHPFYRLYMLGIRVAWQARPAGNRVPWQARPNPRMPLARRLHGH